MVFLKKLIRVVAVAFLVLVLPSWTAALFGHDGSDELTRFSTYAALLVLFGGVIYLAVDAALRHNRT
jgi:hypothetical protein